VGKTTIASLIQDRLNESGLNCAWVNCVGDLTGEPYFYGAGSSEGGVLIFHSASYGWLDESLAEKADELGLPISKIDLHIFIYRPDKPFRVSKKLTEIADIMIRNEKAVDKPPTG
jgi:hypothetical protein